MGLRRANAVINNNQGQLVCVADKNESFAKEYARRFECEYYTSYKKVAARIDVDAVIVSLPNNLHAQVAVDAMKHGKHVFCEKPLALTPSEARLMVETAREQSVFLKTGSNVRFFPNVMKGKEIIDEGQLGKILFTRGWIGHSGWNLKKGSWFVDHKMIGGGTLLDNGCHLIDIIRWFTGEIKECIGYCATRLHNIEKLEDNASAIMIGEDGVVSTICCSWTDWHGYLYIEVYGEKGALYIDNRGEECKLIFIQKESNEPVVFDYSTLPKTSFQHEVDNFIDCILHGKQPLPSGYDGMRVVEIIHAIYKSSKMGKRVEV